MERTNFNVEAEVTLNDQSFALTSKEDDEWSEVMGHLKRALTELMEYIPRILADASWWLSRALEWLSPHNEVCLESEVRSWLSKYLQKVPENFVDSWRDGLLLIYLLNELRPGCCDEVEGLDQYPGPFQVFSCAFQVLETHFDITPDGTAEELLACCSKDFASSLLSLLHKLKEKALENEDQWKKEYSLKKIKSNQVDDVLKGVSCVAKGSGLMVGVVDSIARFSILYRRTDNLNIVIKIEGPQGTMCCERITNRSPKRKRPIQLSTSGVYQNEEIVSHNIEEEDLETDLSISLTYEILPKSIDVSYIPKVEGAYRISILQQGENISGSPFEVIVQAAIRDHGSDVSLSKGHNSKTGKMSVMFDGDKKDRLGRIIRKRVLRFIVTANGSDVVVETDSMSNLASELLKMDYNFQKTPLSRRNSWGFTGDAERKISVIRQFGVDENELEAQSSRRLSRSYSFSYPAPKKTLQKSLSYECEDVQPLARLQTVTEGRISCFTKVKDDTEVEFQSLDYSETSIVEEYSSQKDIRNYFESSGPAIPLSQKLMKDLNDTDCECDVELRQSVSATQEDVGSGFNSSDLHLCDSNKGFKVTEADLVKERKDVRSSSDSSEPDLCDNNCNVQPDFYEAERVDECGSQTDSGKFSDSSEPATSSSPDVEVRQDFVAGEPESGEDGDSEASVSSEDIRQEALMRSKVMARFKKEFQTMLDSERERRQYSTPATPERYQGLLPEGLNDLSEDAMFEKLVSDLDCVFQTCNEKAEVAKKGEHDENDDDESPSVFSKIKFNYFLTLLPDLLDEAGKMYASDMLSSNNDTQHQEMEANVSVDLEPKRKHNVDNGSNFLISTPKSLDLILDHDDLPSDFPEKILSATLNKDSEPYRNTVAKSPAIDCHNGSSTSDRKSRAKSVPVTPIGVATNSKTSCDILVTITDKDCITVSTTPIGDSHSIAAIPAVDVLSVSKSPNSEPSTTDQIAHNESKASAELFSNCSSQFFHLSSLEQYHSKKQDVFAQDEYVSPVKQKIQRWERYSTPEKSPVIKCNVAPVSQSQSVRQKVSFWEGGNEGVRRESRLTKAKAKRCLLFEGNSTSLLEDDVLIEIDRCPSGQNKASTPIKTAISPKIINRIPNDSNSNSTRIQASGSLVSEPSTSMQLSVTKRLGQNIRSDVSLVNILDTSSSEDHDDNDTSEDVYFDDDVSASSPVFYGELTPFAPLQLEDLVAPHEVEALHLIDENEVEELFKTRNLFDDAPSKVDCNVPPRAEACKAFGSAMYFGHVSIKNTFEVLTEGAGSGSLSVSVWGLENRKIAFTSVEYRQKNVYEVTYQVLVPGLYWIVVRWMDQPIRGSPFLCKVTY